MKNELLFAHLSAAGFTRTPRDSTTKPIVIHGVPGSGKTTLIKELLTKPGVEVYTCGPAYGDTLWSKGAVPLSDYSGSTCYTILDEYQLAPVGVLSNFSALFGDPYQGSTRLEPHFVKSISHRVPRPICTFLTNLGFQISGLREGTVLQLPLFSTKPQSPTPKVLHLGPVSSALTHSHGVCSSSTTDVQGQEFDHVTLVCHSSELKDRAQLYVAATRSLNSLHILSDHDFSEALR